MNYEKIRNNVILFVSGAAIFLILIFIATSNQRVYINTYSVSSPIKIEQRGIGRYVYQDISFKNEDGELIELSGLFNGDTASNEVHVYRIGKWKWQTELNIGYKYIVSTELLSDE